MSPSKAPPSLPVLPPVPVGLSTKAGLSTAAIAFAAGAVNLVANQPTSETITLFAGGFASLITVLLGRYWQASRVPPIAQKIALIADELLERAAAPRK